MQNQKKFRKTRLTALLLSVLLLSLLALPSMSALAFEGGDGTAKNPYLLKTAKDVNDIRKNLKAHYKLAATIDMSSIKDFQPIGTGPNVVDSENFTGSLTCDLGKDGLPRYAILNLSVANNIGTAYGYKFRSANYAGFGDKGVHYLAALFGKTKGASFKNIYILNASIKNTVPGQHAGIWDNAKQMYNMFKQQVDTQGTGILVARADSTTFDGCGAQGKINSYSNQTGGLIGYICNGSLVTRSWSDVTMNTEGFWNVAGFIGSMIDSQVQYCYSKGTATALSGASKGFNNGNSFAGFNNSIGETGVITDCYSMITLKAAPACSYSGGFGPGYDSKTGASIGTVKNCYTTSTREDKVLSNDFASTNNNWVLKGATQQYFKIGTAAEIKAAFTGLKGWDTSGDLPKLSGCAYVTDYSMWAAGKERAGAGDAPATSGNTSTTASATDSTDATASGTTSGNTNGTNSGAAETQQLISPENNEVTPLYIVLFICIFAVIISISTFSFILLLPVIKAKKGYIDIDSGKTEEDL